VRAERPLGTSDGRTMRVSPNPLRGVRMHPGPVGWRCKRTPESLSRTSGASGAAGASVTGCSSTGVSTGISTSSAVSISGSISLLLRPGDYARCQDRYAPPSTLSLSHQSSVRRTGRNKCRALKPSHRATQVRLIATRPRYERGLSKLRVASGGRATAGRCRHDALTLCHPTLLSGARTHARLHPIRRA
jgi:hypothetical protein